MELLSARWNLLLKIGSIKCALEFVSEYWISLVQIGICWYKSKFVGTNRDLSPKIGFLKSALEKLNPGTYVTGEGIT
ncbi:MAG: hypothetical protein KDI79_27425, partial [Anaerolineae bacterium]|nr:hypothetical protein [Anaerolineae bacterium]